MLAVLADEIARVGLGSAERDALRFPAGEARVVHAPAFTGGVEEIECSARTGEGRQGEGVQ